jgi:N-acetylmuramoyl-L-alanine amidase
MLTRKAPSSPGKLQTFPVVESYCVDGGQNTMVRGIARLTAAPVLFHALLGLACASLLPGLPALASESPTASTNEAMSEGNITHGLAKMAAAVSRNSALQGDVQRTRFLIGLDKSVTFTVLSLGNPNRVVVELPDVPLRLPQAPGNEPVGLVKAFRGGVAGPGKLRVVIDVTEPVVVESAKIESDSSGTVRHLALEIIPTAATVKAAVAKKPLKSKPFALGAAGIQPPLPQPARRPDEIAKTAYKPIVVIDPGHGGHDTGAVKNGTVEKDVVLAFSKVLRDKLEETGRYKVLMTRDTDRFIELDERRAFAERHKAALFIAVHADYANTGARGATIYTLRENVADSLKKSAKGEVQRDVLSENEIATVQKTSSSADVSAVREILSDLAQREVDATQERTSLFSRSVIEYMGSSTSMRDKPDQQAAFRVLKTAKFPSVLIELAYVTNKEDARLLQSSEWRNKVADSISTAVENYFSHQLARLPM